MCNIVFLSTDDARDLTKFNSEFIKLEREDNELEPVKKFLQYPYRWYVGSKAGCSCTFRHAVEGLFNFEEPQEWNPEDEDDIQATQELYRMFKVLLNEGKKLDCLDLWDSNGEFGEIKRVEVDLSAIPEASFRLFENHYFLFCS